MNSVLLLALGGALGTIARYYGQQMANKYCTGAFPYGTFAVNVLGCLLIGLLSGRALSIPWLDQEGRRLLITGFCGGFTTFSTFAFENMALLQKGEILVFLYYTLGSIGAGLLMVALGFWLTRPAL